MKPKKITELELKILQHIWNMNNRASVQEILDRWNEPEIPKYTTILKTLQIMEKKGTVTHEKEGKAYKYIPQVAREAVAKKSIQAILSGIYSGDKIAFMHAFLGDADLTRQEIVSLKAFLAEKEKTLK